MRDKKVLFVLPVVGQPRYMKRISMFVEMGCHIDIIAFDRDYHKGSVPKYEIQFIGKIESGRYLRRFVKMLFAIKTIRKKVKSNDLVYAFGPDMALVAIISKIWLKRPVVLEVGDIREIQVKKNVYGALYRIVDRFISEECSLIVATARGYLDEYYKRWLKIDKRSLVIENKLSFENETMEVYKDNAALEAKNEENDKPIKIGYFGVLRCKKSVEILNSLSEKANGKIEVVIYGYVMNIHDVMEKLQCNPFIIYNGTYKFPEDLHAMYDSIDIVWACYPFPDKEDWNWRWARTNRFYESCYYKKPMIALAKSGDAFDVDKYGIGLIIENDKVENIVNRLLRISRKDINEWRESVRKVPMEVYLYTAECEELRNVLDAIV